MSTYTKYKKIEKPLALERYNIDVVNKNNDIIDSELHKLELKNESQDNLLATKEALNVEVLRATTRENALDDSLSGEISRAQSAEIKISNSLESEVNRATTAEAAIRKNLSDHNISGSSHNDMRLLISGLTERLNALADSDDTTLDQLSEIVAYIKNNKSLIENVTTSKVDVSDIIDSLTSTATNKPLSAKQGMVLKDLIDALTTTVGNKVDKVSGKGLSTNDYTTTEKNKLDGIASGAEVNVQSDWNITDPTSDAYIKNKPTAMPASDVPAWAKENTKPSYTKEDVGLGKVPNVSTNDQTPTFTEAEERENISSGDSTSTLWGKVKKWFSDLKTVAFSGKYKDLDEKPYVNGLLMSDGNTDFVVCNSAATEKNKTVTKSGWANAEGSRIRILFKNGCTIASNLQVMPSLLSLALLKNTKNDPFLTNETGVIYEFTWYNAKLVLTGSTGVDSSDITPASIGAVAKTGDSMSGTLSSSKTAGTYLSANKGDAIINSTAAAGAYTALDKLNSTNGYFTDGVHLGKRILAYTEKSTVDANQNGTTKLVTLLDESGNAYFPGKVTAPSFSGTATSATRATNDKNGNDITTTYVKKAGDKMTGLLHVAGGLSVDNALSPVGDAKREFIYLPVFNGYTGDAGSGGIVKYVSKNTSGFAPFWHWATAGNYEGYYYKITVGAKDVDAGIRDWMISFDLSVYQSYNFCKFAISGYVYYRHNEDGSYELVWYEPRAMMITGDYRLDAQNVYFGKDADGHLYIAIDALAYTGLVIDAVNVTYQDIVVDYSTLFSLSIVSTLDNTTKYGTQTVSRPFYLNEANELKNSVSDGKTLVANAITAKGVYTAADATFATMADNIAGIINNDALGYFNSKICVIAGSIPNNISTNYSFCFQPSIYVSPKKYCHLFVIHHGLLSDSTVALSINENSSKKPLYLDLSKYLDGISVYYGYMALESYFDIIDESIQKIWIFMSTKSTTLTNMVGQYYHCYGILFYE